MTSGRILDYEFKRTRRMVERERPKESSGQDVEASAAAEEAMLKKPMDPNDLLDFPLEHARLRHQPICTLPPFFISRFKRSRFAVPFGLRSGKDGLINAASDRFLSFLGKYNRLRVDGPGSCAATSCARIPVYKSVPTIIYIAHFLCVTCYLLVNIAASKCCFGTTT